MSAATKFSDTRHLVHGGFGFERADGGIAFAVAYGWESDYKSFVFSGTTHHDLYEHNFTLALAYSHNFDTVCDADNTAAAGLPLDLVPLTSSAGCFTSMPGYTTHPLSIDTFEPSLSWTMTPRLVIQGGATIQILDGFQSNPYRKVAVGSQNRTPQEHLPEFRQRYALFTRLSYAFPELRGSTYAMVRGYDDSWAVRAITADLVGTKYIGQSMLAVDPRALPPAGRRQLLPQLRRLPHSGAGGPVLDRRPRAVSDGELPARRQALVLPPPAAGAFVLVRRDGAGRQVRAADLPARIDLRAQRGSQVRAHHPGRGDRSGAALRALRFSSAASAARMRG